MASLKVNYGWAPKFVPMFKPRGTGLMSQEGADIFQLGHLWDGSGLSLAQLCALLTGLCVLLLSSQSQICGTT